MAPVEVVRGFVRDVRSGAHPELADRYMAAAVAAHQIVSESEVTVVRTPADYSEHVRDFRRMFGHFELRIEEMIADGDRVYVRWHQTGHHLASLDGEQPTGKTLIEVSSAVYRVSAGRIVEYWIQTDRKGLELQLARSATR
ncbi:ester cyclase [Sphingomonas parva]|uniref:Ester cyclase n=1 Tax=Sphingomonas parva TaxID=2555898 RepID=A0A4Y8ZV19_9SPHN|nr:ester cyclase [Sphingomonas parva]